ncbi:glycosyltransferase involved in cell wall biosynthesis [Bacillus tianshenii]|uniref:Glycosyltransferase involved in cell wall biosynthesis n=1 Tax=Sutcliffiella tianshenii TaxID=1463404 RepID=A0ABS2NVL7_9BACI|nr:glycosyltransferase family 4 protein [Bacillus tianshenii]MBM7618578.1 glycosyltransferase involved in cell wall biosynthesis [Bacillus tianshenii]
MKKKILVVGPLPPPIHGESIAIDTIVSSRNLKKIFNIEVIDTSRGEIKNIGKFTNKKIKDDILRITRLNKLVRNYNTDILYISISQTRFGLLRDIIMINIGRKRVKKVITHLHGNKLGELINSLNNYEKLFVKNGLLKVDVAVVLGDSLRNNFLGFPKKVEIISNGIDEDFIPNELIVSNQERKFQKKVDDPIQIVYLSNLMKSKGYHKIIKSVLNLRKQGFNLTLKLAGLIQDETLFESVMKEVQEENQSQFIEHLGVVTGQEKKDLLLNSDIMVLASDFEGQPISIIEGLAAGLPIISSCVGAIPDLILDNGILLKDPTIAELQTHISEISTDKQMRIEMGKKSRELFLEKFTNKVYLENLTKIFKDNGE